MKAVGIIAEYNPFHSGHAYHIRKVKEASGADTAIVLMSGDFVQRGAPAVTDKYTRAEMALRGGADLVLELPVTAALSSAETFARTGISLLTQSGIAEEIGFGCETADTAILQGLADLFCEEPADYRRLLLNNLKQGSSFPAARAKAAADFLSTDHSSLKDEKSAKKGTSKPGAETFCSAGTFAAEIREILSLPNNILAIEYLKAIRQTASGLEAVMVQRRGAYSTDAPSFDGSSTRFSDQDSAAEPSSGSGSRFSGPVSMTAPSSGSGSFRFSDNYNVAEGYQSNLHPGEHLSFSSAGEIRSILHNQDSGIFHDKNAAEELLGEHIPSGSLSALLEALCEVQPICEDDFSVLLHSRILEEAYLNKKQREKNRILLQEEHPSSSDTHSSGEKSACFSGSYSSGEKSACSSGSYYSGEKSACSSGSHSSGEELFCRILNLSGEFCSFSSFAQLVKTKNQTYTAVSRALTRILLGIDERHTAALKEENFAPYFRVLGFRSGSAALLSQMKAAGIPLLVRLSEDIKQLNENQRLLLDADLHAANIYRCIQTQKSGRSFKNEFRRPLIIL